MCLLLLYCQITVLPDKNKEMNSVVGVYSCIVYTLLSSSNAVLLLPDCPHVSRYLNHCLSLSEFLSGIPPIYYLIGVWQPQKYFWMLILFVHFPAKLLVGSMYPQVWPTTGRLSPRTFIFWSCFSEGISFVLLSVFNVESSFGFNVHAFFFITWTAASTATMIVFLNFLILKVILLLIFIMNTIHPLPDCTPILDKNEYFAFCIIEYIMVDENGWFWMTSKPDHKSVPWPAVEPSIFLPLKWLSLASTLLPAAGVYFCVAYTFTFGKEAISNLTLSSCPDVKSGLPPISYSIGSWEPQKLIWLLVLFTHFPPRIFLTMLYPQVWAPGSGKVWIASCCALEGISLVLITIFDVDSIAGFHVHAAFFASWAFGSVACMGVTVHLMRLTGLKDRSELFHRTFIYKCLLLASFILAVAVASVLYPMSQRFCLSWAYSIFCIFEYSLVGMNAAFWAINLHEFSTIYVGFRITSVRTEALEWITVDNKYRSIVQIFIGCSLIVHIETTGANKVFIITRSQLGTYKMVSSIVNLWSLCEMFL
ncbi:hypothetical protein PRIPAC_81457 [Pristionchus pacificus]|uniref:CWH43-like N-terminal domain-containing protein n=1 Tax=Pristionchus pacificus TaxID=54126 RepID=A0A2A6C1W9_PRIPA|nr:hypothetical protein PRIPAC_81457 [Pristionchus pacificus]|eukprot:PDM72126.1 hypothetical protein PRIPAC_38560 [Pristionchus pacificus]